MRIVINVSSSERLEQSFEQTSVVIGRSKKKCDFIVPEESLSREHCRVDQEGDNFFITDLESANGVFIDGKRIPPNEKTLYPLVLSLMIGPFECQIIGYEGTRSLINLSPLLNEKKPYPAITSSTAFQEKKPEPPKPIEKKKESKKAIIQMACVLLGLSAVAWYQLQEEEIPQIITPTPATVTTQAPTAPVMRNYVTRTDYLSRFNKKNCKGDAKAICNELGLDVKSGEGAFIEDERTFVFLTPSRLLKEPAYQKIKKSRGKESAIALHQLLKSSLIKDLSNGKMKEVYLVLMNSYGIMKLVHQIKSQSINSEILPELENAIKLNELEKVLTKYSSAIPTTEMSGGFRK